jgi:hypothetical protein
MVIVVISVMPAIIAFLREKFGKTNNAHN